MHSLRALLIQLAIVAVVCGAVWWGLHLGEEKASSKPAPTEPSPAADTTEKPAAREQEERSAPPLATGVSGN